MLLSLLGMYLVYALSFRLSGTKLCGTRLYKGLLRNSFGRYLYSDPLNYIVLRIGAMCFGSWVFTTGAGVGMLFLLRFAVTLVGAYRVSERIRKFRIKYLV